MFMDVSKVSEIVAKARTRNTSNAFIRFFVEGLILNPCVKKYAKEF
jgi:hypothetical protein